MEIQLQFNSRFEISGVPTHHLVFWPIIKSGNNILRPITNFQASFAGELQHHNRKKQFQFSDHEKNYTLTGNESSFKKGSLTHCEEKLMSNVFVREKGS